MRVQILRRAAGLAMAALLIGATGVFADTVPADGRDDVTGDQPFVDLGQRIVGESVTWPVDFSLVCFGTSHALPGQTATIALSSVTRPLDGSASATPTTIGPVPDGWAAGGCATPAPTLPAIGPSIVTLVMPSSPGTDFLYTLMYSRAGFTGLTGITAISFQVDVVPNTAPTLGLPGDLTAEATTGAGAVVTYAASATDAEDDPDPTPTCSPPSGATFAIGTTTVNCSVTDRIGSTVSGAFNITVVDTTGPSVTVPADISVVASSAAGVAIDFAATATDAVDGALVPTCSPASGWTFPVGTTTVTCSVSDAAGNTGSAAFSVSVTFEPGVTYDLRWLEPIGGTPPTLVANHGRTVPVKVEVMANGSEVSSGDVALVVTPCAGGASLVLPMAWEGSDRWAGHLDTALLAGPGCQTAMLTVDGQDAGSFRLDLRGVETAAGATPKGKRR